MILITCNPVAFLATKNFSENCSIWAAGGVNAGIHLAKINNDDVIGFDMGGTSTGVWHYAGEVEKDLRLKFLEYIWKLLF